MWDSRPRLSRRRTAGGGCPTRVPKRRSRSWTPPKTSVPGDPVGHDQRSRLMPTRPRPARPPSFAARRGPGVVAVLVALMAGTAAAGEVPEVVRLHVPAGSLADWRDGPDAPRPMPAEQFDRLVREAGARAVALAEPLRVRHEARWEDGVLIGRTTVHVEAPAGDGARWVALDPWSPAIEAVRPGSCLLGHRDGDGRAFLRVDAAAVDPIAEPFARPGGSVAEVVLDWRLAARPGSHGRSFELRLPDRAAASIRLDLPEGFEPTGPPGYRSGPEPGPGPGRHRWRFDGPGGAFALRLAATGAGTAGGDAAPWVEASTVVAIGGGDALRLVAAGGTPPDDGRNLIVVAAGDDGLRFRVFDAAGARVVDLGEADLPGRSRAIDDLKEQLRPLWGLAEPPAEARRRVVAAVAAILDRPLDGDGSVARWSVGLRVEPAASGHRPIVVDLPAGVAWEGWSSADGTVAAVAAEAGDRGGTRLTVRFREGSSGPAELRLDGLATIADPASWEVPGAVPRGVRWVGGPATVRIGPPWAVLRAVDRGGRRIDGSSAEADADDGSATTLAYFADRPGPVATLELGRTPTLARATVRGEWRSRDGPGRAAGRRRGRCPPRRAGGPGTGPVRRLVARRGRPRRRRCRRGPLGGRARPGRRDPAPGLPAGRRRRRGGPPDPDRHRLALDHDGRGRAAGPAAAPAGRPAGDGRGLGRPGPAGRRAPAGLGAGARLARPDRRRTPDRPRGRAAGARLAMDRPRRPRRARPRPGRRPPRGAGRAAVDDRRRPGRHRLARPPRPPRLDARRVDAPGGRRAPGRRPRTGPLAARRRRPPGPAPGGRRRPVGGRPAPRGARGRPGRARRPRRTPLGRRGDPAGPRPAARPGGPGLDRAAGRRRAPGRRRGRPELPRRRPGRDRDRDRRGDGPDDPGGGLLPLRWAARLDRPADGPAARGQRRRGDPAGRPGDARDGRRPAPAPAPPRRGRRRLAVAGGPAPRGCPARPRGRRRRPGRADRRRGRPPGPDAGGARGRPAAAEGRRPRLRGRPARSRGRHDPP